MTYRTQYGLQTRRCWSHLLLKVDSSKNTTFIHSSVVHKRCLVAKSNLSTLFSRVKSGLWQDILLRSPTERRRSLMVVRDICRPSSCCISWAVIKGSQQAAATINLSSSSVVCLGRQSRAASPILASSWKARTMRVMLPSEHPTSAATLLLVRPAWTRVKIWTLVTSSIHGILCRMSFWQNSVATHLLSNFCCPGT